MAFPYLEMVDLKSWLPSVLTGQDLFLTAPRIKKFTKYDIIQEEGNVLSTKRK